MLAVIWWGNYQMQLPVETGQSNVQINKLGDWCDDKQSEKVQEAVYGIELDFFASLNQIVSGLTET